MQDPLFDIILVDHPKLIDSSGCANRIRGNERLPAVLKRAYRRLTPGKAA